MFILDTDTLSLLHAGHEKIGQRISRVDSAEVATTVVSKIEILRARHAFLLKAETGDQLLRAQQWLHQSEELLAKIAILPF
jgi:tRNA(fMet)-specific endonuclease VapC